MTQSGTVIDIIGLEDSPYKFLEDVVIFVGRFGAGIGGDRISAVIADNPYQLIGHIVKCFIPTGFTPFGRC